MKILGSSKIDDFQKIILGNKVVKALNIKSGDSVLFYKSADDRIEMFKAEGAHITDECDSCQSLHLRGMRKTLRTLMAVSLVLVLISLAIVYLPIYFPSVFPADGGAGDLLPFLDMNDLGLVLGIVGITVFFASMVAVSRLDVNEEDQRLVTIGGPYSKNRLTGLTKLVSDGHALTGSVYINSLFGTNPVALTVKVDYDNGASDTCLIKCIKSVPGYVLYKVKVPFQKDSAGTMTVDFIYQYTEKRIHVTEKFKLDQDEKNLLSVRVKDLGVDARIEFDKDFQKAAFDDSIFDPTDDDSEF